MDILGMISLVMIMVFPLIGAILGLVGIKEAKSKGHNPILSQVGFWINFAICMFWVLLIVVYIGILIASVALES